MKLAYLLCGGAAFLIGVIGIFLPLLPAVPFMLLAAFFFARSNPAWEQRLLHNPRFGPHILAWRERRAISLKGKIAALVGLTGSALGGLLFLEGDWRYAPFGVALLCGIWIGTRPSA